MVQFATLVYKHSLRWSSGNMEQKVSLVIPDSVLYSARMTTGELAQEVAVLLILVHYDVAEFEADLQTLRGALCDAAEALERSQVARSARAPVQARTR
jgi:hypothetical protein